MQLNYYQAGITVLERKKDVPRGVPVNLHTHRVVQRTRFWNKRDVCMELDIPAPAAAASAGTPSPDKELIIVPSTYFPEDSGKFCLTATTLKGSITPLLSRFTSTSDEYPFVQSIESEWSSKTAGGAYKASSQTFKRNPVFTLVVENDDTAVCLTLRQWRKQQSHNGSSEAQRKVTSIKWHKIGIYLLRSSAQAPLKKSDKIAASKFINLPEVCLLSPPKERLQSRVLDCLCNVRARVGSKVHNHSII